MKIRPILQKDLKAIAKIHADAFGESRRFAPRPLQDSFSKRIKGACLLAEENGKIAGAIFGEKKITFVPNAGFIRTFFVSKEFRGKGAGKMLMQKCLVALKKAGITSVSLTCNMKNKAALALYKRYGFKPFSFLLLKKF